MGSKNSTNAESNATHPLVVKKAKTILKIMITILELTVDNGELTELLYIISIEC